jgi:hypothetical protein
VKKFVLELYHRKKNWVIGIGLLLFLNIISFAGIAFFQRPALEHKRALATERQKDLDALTGGDVSAVYRVGKSDLGKLQAMIPPKRRFAPLLGEIMESTTVCRISTESLTYKPEYLRERKLLAYRIALSVNGRYASLRCFLYEMQTKKELVVIDGITLKSDDPYAENVSMELKLTAYLRDEA